MYSWECKSKLGHIILQLLSEHRLITEHWSSLMSQDFASSAESTMNLVSWSFFSCFWDLRYNKEVHFFQGFFPHVSFTVRYMIILGFQCFPSTFDSMKENYLGHFSNSNNFSILNKYLLCTKCCHWNPNSKRALVFSKTLTFDIPCCKFVAISCLALADSQILPSDFRCP